VTRPRAEAGFTLVALLATIAVMMILMTVGSSSWRYVMKNEREEEAIFRGVEVTTAIRRFQKKAGNALPPTLEILVEKKFLRKHALRDPLAKDGKWKLIHQGDLIAPIKAGSEPAGRGFHLQNPEASPSPSSAFGFHEQKVGPIVGVGTKAKGKSLRVFNGQQDYSAWIFTINQPKPIIGALPVPVPRGGKAPGLSGDKNPKQR
jgi:Prokaryotic N-terminal methylation motif